MTARHPLRTALATALSALALFGCSRAKPTAPWPPITDPVVFIDRIAPGVGFNPFAGSKTDAQTIDETESHTGTSSLRFTVPNPNDPTGGYAGGAFVANQPRSLTSYNALSFWVKASRTVLFETAGFGNDNTGTSRYEAKRSSIAVGPAWSHVVVPIPLAAKLTKERGMFFLAEGPQTGAGLTLWIDDVQFVDEPTITNPRPAITSQNLNAFVGTTFTVPNTRTTFAVAGLDQTVLHMPAYFSWASSNSAVATVTDGVVRVLGTGTAAITARLGEVAATGVLTVNGIAPPPVAAPTPTLAAANVISLFSNAYPNVPVDTWSATWDNATVSDLQIAGNDTKVYTNLVFAGIEFGSRPIDASTMTHVHLDTWIPAGTVFKVKLVDFGANGIAGGGDDSEHELTFDAASTPPLATGAWVGFDLPLASFTGLTGRAHLAQIVLSGDTRTVFVDNVYFHR